MADIKISALPGASALDGTETIPVVQGGVTKKVTTDQFLTKDASGNVGVGTASPVSKVHVEQYDYATAGLTFSAALETGRKYQLSMVTGNNFALTDTAAAVQCLVVDTSGNLGLGVTPSAWGSAFKAIDIGVGSALANLNSGTDTVLASNSYRATSNWIYKTSQEASYYRQASGQHQWYIAPSGTAGNAISFTQAMTLDAVGNLGVGVTPSALFRLDINGNARISSASAEGFEVQPGAITYVIAYNRGTAAYTPMAVAGEYISFSTGLGAERARIDSSGNLLVGTAIPIGGGHSFKQTAANVASFYRTTSTGTDWLTTWWSDVDSTLALRATCLANGNFQNTNNSYGAFSDVKLKENITDASPKLAKLMQVRIVNYNLKSDPDKTKLIGVVAQELEKVSPGLIEETADRDAEGNDLGTTTKSVKYSVFVPMLIKSLQEQQAQIDAQQAQLDALMARLAAAGI